MVRDETDKRDYWSILVSPTTPSLDNAGREACASARQLGLAHIVRVHAGKLYFIKGQVDSTTVETIAAELLADPVAESFQTIRGLVERPRAQSSIEIHYLPGVMDPVALTTLAAVRRTLEARGLRECQIEEVRTGHFYQVVGARSAEDLDLLARHVLHNACIQKAYISGLGRRDPLPTGFPEPVLRPFEIRRVGLSDLDDDGLAGLSRDGHLFLSLEEMRTIRSHYDALGRDPTDLELETLAQTWSEHCVHKTLRSSIEYAGEDFGRKGAVTLRFDNLFKNTIVDATKRVGRDWCLSVFHDNAGVIAFDGEYGVAFKVETHNHPSAIEPYGGAATGIGGCIRDIMGCGLGAKPIASTDVFCLAEPTFDETRLPKGVLHPLRVLRGVVGGVRDYGNRMGIPTVNGAVYFDERYLGNPLVFCGCVGLIPRDRVEKDPRPGDLIVVAGGCTGRDGIHGATFSSAELADTHADEFSHAVQIGNAIEEKKLLDALLLARDHPKGCLYSAVTDCGAGGLSSAVGEMGEELGAIVDLEKAPLKYAGLTYDEIWISEAQERMVFAVPPQNVEAMLALFEDEEVEATVIGSFSDDRVLRVRYRGETVGELDMSFLHHGLPTTTRAATWTRPTDDTAWHGSVSRVREPSDRAQCAPIGKADAAVAGPPRRSTTHSADEQLLAQLQSLNVASKEWVIRQYDHEVQGGSVIKPLMGPGFGPSDAAVLRPRLDSRRAVAIGCGLCPDLSDVDPYWMAIATVDEALRNVICVGGDPKRTAILDNFCWPKCDSEEMLGALVRTCRGAADAAVAYGLPFISGKDSLNNEFVMAPAEAHRLGLPERIAIPPTLLISAISIVADAGGCVSIDLKTPGNVVVLASAPVDEVGLESAVKLHRQVAGAIADGKIRSAHDVSDGGLAVALAEMCIASNLGLDVKLDAARGDEHLFSALQTTYLLEMTPEEALVSGWPIVATVRQEPTFTLRVGGKRRIRLPVSQLADAWRSPLKNGGGT